MPVAVLLCLVVGISDGDTLMARCGDPGQYQRVKVRLAEIDAPEKAQPFGQRSKQALSDLCYRVEATIRPNSTDRYGRTIARVECRGKDASLEQVRAGMAWAYTRYLTDPEVKMQEESAHAAGLGLWRDAAPIAPWVWRRS